MILYILIFSLKLIENTLSTLRMIVLTNGKKILSSILQFIISLIWVLSISLSITNIKDDPIKILVFAFGCAIGSILGSFIEEKLALGENIIICINNKNNKIKINDNIYLLAIKRKNKQKEIEKLKQENNMILSTNLDFSYGIISNDK